MPGRGHIEAVHPQPASRLSPKAEGQTALGKRSGITF
jgi:hypothetical protein